ncbi:restriction endonuclease subunit S [Bacillus thuringiensis LM1212]|uniref:restriction endonuclease subunit S n=1 Tax=Bacillus thuringiensis TaxID=1428 RepID=UPI000427950F|nr:restriction endonuclease subunit S [Bacillus thuringiensis]AXY08012.1 restriction endonuclease subunit S [Bacillus thuringiensis LM1212]
MEFKEIELRETTIEIIDGDRGKNYPKKTEMKDIGHTLFLNNKNIINDYLDISKGEYISEEKSSLLRKGKLERNDLVMSTRGSVGNIGYFSEKIEWDHIRINSGMVILRNRDSKIDTEYLYFLLKSPLMKERYKELISGSVQNQLPIRDLQRVKLIYPEVHKQKQIVKLIGSLENKIQLNKKVINNLEEISQTLFKHWFIDFEFPNEQGHPYKSSSGEMVESELGEIPKEWKVGTASNLFDFSPTEKLSKGALVKYLEMKDLQNSAMIYQYTDREFKSGSKFRNGDTLLARITPCLENGKIGFVDFLDKDEVGWGSTEFIVIRTKPEISKTFSYFFAADSAFKDYAIINMNGSSGRQRVKAETLAQYKIAIPPLQLIKQFTDIADANMRMMTNLKLQINKLEKLRDTLIPKLLSGEIEIPDELEV